MKRLLLTGGCVLALSMPALAHFVFVVPEAGGRRAQVLLSETLAPDAEVDVALIAQTRLSLRTAGGRETPLTLEKAVHAFGVALPSAGPGVVHGMVDLGVTTRPGTPAHVLRYHPKTILGDPFAPSTRVGDVPVELVPVGAPDAFQLLLLGGGRPFPYAEVTVIGPDGAQGLVRTDADGRTGTFRERGRYGAWARYWERTPGEVGGTKYEEVRHYATLVFDTASQATPAAAATVATATRVATLPEPVASFGAVGLDGWLYVYGGHVSMTHRYSTSAVSGRFSRVRLTGGAWETLPPGPPAQGLNLAAHGGRIYRVGGMQPQNPPGQPPDTRSLADVSRFDPSRGQWEALPPLPAPRSSHDVVVVGNRLFVIGGWNMRGADAATEWPATMEVLDLAAADPKWTSLPQPFKRRAFVAAAHDETIYVVGGFDERSQVVRGIDIYDVRRGTWSSGPALPGGALNGFGPAAASMDGRLIVSIDDGTMHRLRADRSGWELVGRASPRIVHRLVPDGRRVLIAGGAKSGANLDLVEALPVQP